MCEMFSWHLSLLIQINHHMNATAYLEIVAKHVYSLMFTICSYCGNFQFDNANCHKGNWFYGNVKHGIDFSISL